MEGGAARHNFEILPKDYYGLFGSLLPNSFRQEVKMLFTTLCLICIFVKFNVDNKM